MTKPFIRDFIYLDVERIRSFVAQASGGLTSEITSQAQHQVGGEGQVAGGLPLVARASGSIDYHYLKSHSETKSLHDHIFEEFYRCLKPGEHLTDLSDIDETAWVESSFRDSAFILARGLVKIVDYQSIIATTQSLPTLLETLGRLSTIASGANMQPNVPNSPKTKGHPKGSTNPQTQTAELQQLRTQLRNLPIKEFISFVNQMYGDLVRIKVFPLQNSLEKLFVGTADRALFRYSPSALVNLYGSVIDAGWASVLKVNKGLYYEPGLVVSKTGNDMEDSLEQLADIFSSLASMTQGFKFPAVAVTPIAIYREI